MFKAPIQNTIATLIQGSTIDDIVEDFLFLRATYFFLHRHLAASSIRITAIPKATQFNPFLPIW